MKSSVGKSLLFDRLLHNWEHRRLFLIRQEVKKSAESIKKRLTYRDIGMLMSILNIHWIPLPKKHRLIIPSNIMILHVSRIISIIFGSGDQRVLQL